MTFVDLEPSVYIIVYVNLRFVSESSPRLISVADGSDLPLPQMLVLLGISSLHVTHPKGIPSHAACLT